MMSKSNLFFSLLMLIFLFFFGAYFCHPINQFWDIIGADEIMYLKFGKNLFGDISFDWGFLYNVWYKFLSLFQHNTVALYYLNYRILIVAIPVLLYICLSVYNVHSLIAFIISFLFLISKLHVTTWPFVCDFCIVLMLIYFIVIKFIKDNGWKSIFLSFICFLLYLTRPEFIISFGLAALFAIYSNWQHKLRWILLLIPIPIMIYIKQHAHKLDGLDRDLYAYVYHYFFTYMIWHRKEKIDTIAYFAITPKIFGTSYTLVGSILHNPLVFVTHVATCTGFYFMNLVKSIEDFLLPSVYFHFLGKIKHVLFVVFIIFIGIRLFKRKEERKILLQDNAFFAGIVILFLGACISNFVIGYSQHYVQLHFILYLLLLAIILFKDVEVKLIMPIQFGLCIVLFFCLPSLKKYNFVTPDFAESKNLPVQKLAAFINKTNDHKSHYMIIHQSSLHFAFDGNNFQSKECYILKMPFLQFVYKNKVDYIYITKQLLEDATLNKDAEWRIFIANPENYHFYKQTLPGTANYLLIKK